MVFITDRPELTADRVFIDPLLRASIEACEADKRIDIDVQLFGRIGVVSIRSERYPVILLETKGEIFRLAGTKLEFPIVNMKPVIDKYFELLDLRR